MENRPTNPTIAQIRDVCQPVSITGRANSEHWVADVYLRSISPYLTKVLLKTPISANGVTYLMILSGIAISASLLISGWTGLLLALFFSQLQMLWDCCDGEVARWRQTSSAMGVFLDRVGHYFAEGLIPIAFGFRLATEGDYLYPLMGALLSVLVLLNKSFNDSVHVARAYSGLTKLADSKNAGTPTNSSISSVRKIFDFIPVQRAFHSVEMTILIVLFHNYSNLLAVGLIICFFVTIGHLIMIINSSKLRGV
ncbi:MAG: hypothetical protein RLZ57_1020 [Actinomycetota bacterium]|jgi:phosphatidylglycerophosphate synthase